MNMNKEENGPTIIWATCIISPKSAAESYKYNIQVMNKELVDKRVIFKSGKNALISEGTKLCVPCDLSHEQVRKDGEYFVLGKKTLAKAVREDGTFAVFLTIYKA